MDKQFMESKRGLVASMFGILNILLLFLIVWFAVGINNKIKEGRYIGQGEGVKNTITVSDTAELYAKPDVALVLLSVVSEGKTVTQAMQDNTAKMNSVIEFVKEQGVDAKDLKTVNFNISPRYEWLEKGECIPPCPSGRRVLAGYDVSQSLQVKIREMDKIGGLIEGATQLGVNELGDLQFTIDEQEALKKQVRDEAIEKVRAKAQELAAKLGVNLVRIVNFSESGTTPRFYDLKEAAALGLGGSVVPQIETGENKIEATVSITYEVN